MDLQVQPESDHTLGCSSEVQKLQSISLLENDGKTREAIYWTAMFLMNDKPFLAHVRSSVLAGSHLFPGALAYSQSLGRFIGDRMYQLHLQFSYCITAWVHAWLCMCLCVRMQICAPWHPWGGQTTLSVSSCLPPSLRQGLLLVPVYTRLPGPWASGDSLVLSLI